MSTQKHAMMLIFPFLPVSLIIPKISAGQIGWCEPGVEEVPRCEPCIKSCRDKRYRRWCPEDCIPTHKCYCSYGFLVDDWGRCVPEEMCFTLGGNGGDETRSRVSVTATSTGGTTNSNNLLRSSVSVEEKEAGRTRSGGGKSPPQFITNAHSNGYGSSDSNGGDGGNGNGNNNGGNGNHPQLTTTRKPGRGQKTQTPPPPPPILHHVHVVHGEHDHISPFPPHHLTHHHDGGEVVHVGPDVHDLILPPHA